MFPLRPGTRPINRRLYRVHPRVRDAIHRCVDQLVEDDVVEKRLSQRGGSVTLATRSEGSPRFCVDYQNTIKVHSKKEEWSIPDMTSRIDAVQGTNFISVMGIRSAYHQIPIAPQDIPKNESVTQRGSASSRGYLSGLPTPPGSSPY